ncbi:hypothetical protein BpHYR1_018268 [Brachionus plicatilis]|uniref:Uncharacterized protein n=1 Tax=Brachionus plicatilis TaxID=10195 RepID=A0A3M7QMH5_BRAPC|nr:hypothetical protein BpHYR1_018268 [Brachionus plicatilis]
MLNKNKNESKKKLCLLLHCKQHIVIVTISSELWRYFLPDLVFFFPCNKSKNTKAYLNSNYMYTINFFITLTSRFKIHSKHKYIYQSENKSE